MQVLDSTLERALLDIFKAGGLQAGGALSVAALQRAWALTGLRESDFRDAVRILLRRGLLEVKDRVDTMDIVLTADGVRRLQSDAFRNPTQEADLEDLRTLETVRGRVKAAHRPIWSGTRAQRRRDDQLSGAAVH